MIMHDTTKVLSESDALTQSFHDCHVHGVGWRHERHEFLLDLKYILEWISPENEASAYSFLVSEARLVFHNVDDLQITMDWNGCALGAEIDEIRIVGSRTTPNKSQQRCFEIEFSNPSGVVVFWSTGYELILIGDSVVVPTPAAPAIVVR